MFFCKAKPFEFKFPWLDSHVKQMLKQIVYESFGRLTGVLEIADYKFLQVFGFLCKLKDDPIWHIFII